jgi:hypothetical protein
MKAKLAADAISERNALLVRACKAIIFGSCVPLAMCVMWGAVSCCLTAGSLAIPGADQLITMLSAEARIAVPVAFLVCGAIGTTLLASFLAMGHFAADVTCQVFSYCSPRATVTARALTVGLPCLLACAGKGLYLPLLAFAGAYPTTVLYLLAPPLSLLALRRRAQQTRVAGAQTTLELFPGGSLALGTLVIVAALQMGVCAVGDLSAPAQRAYGLVRRFVVGT